MKVYINGRWALQTHRPVKETVPLYEAEWVSPKGVQEIVRFSNLNDYYDDIAAGMEYRQVGEVEVEKVEKVKPQEPIVERSIMIGEVYYRKHKARVLRRLRKLLSNKKFDNTVLNIELKPAPYRPLDFEDWAEWMRQTADKRYID